MASTIQIKRGTGSAVPSGLADGELAINLDSGKLYFGSGSTSVDNFTFGELTAEKYIVSSSVLYVTTSFSSGSTEFGDTADDTHTFTGNITASGNISSSGNIIAPNLIADSASFSTRVALNDAKVTNTDQSLVHLAVTSSNVLFGDITASGNISASGTIIGNINSSDTSANTTFYPRFGLSGADELHNTNGFSFNPSSDTLSLGGVIAIAGQAGTITGLNSLTSTNITASGNISSSGNVYALDYFDNGVNINTIYSPIAGGSGIVTVGTIGTGTWNGDVIVEAKLENQSGTNTGDQNISNLAVTSSNVLFGDITASGNISSSANVYAANVYVPTDGLIAGADPNNQNIKFESTSELEINSSTVTIDAAVVNIDSSTGIVNFKDTSTTQFSLDMDGTDGAQVLQLKVVGDDLIFKSHGGDPLMTLKSEGQTEIHSNITASNHISASGNIYADNFFVKGNTAIVFNSNTLRIGFQNDTPVSIGKSGNPIEFFGTVTASDVTLDRIIYNTASSALGSNGAIGDIVKFGNTSTFAGTLYYLKNDGTWDRADADAVGSATGSLAIAAATNSSGGMCLRGFVNPYTDPGAGIGNPVYLGTTLGTMQSAAPTGTGDIVRIVGYQYGTDLVYFNPSNDYIVHA